ncbi:MAG TPA: MtnX-like HAD-IB family phosphatase [Candidatus Kryptonia bacterium]
MSRLIPRVFVDFDGTITKQDVGNAFFRKFGDEKVSLELVRKWKAGTLSGKELLLGEAATVRTSYTEAVRFVESLDIDMTFLTFLDYCRTAGIEITVLSDGLDFYIERIMEKNAIAGLPVYSNRARFVSDRLEVDTPYESDCKWCANCKGFQILSHSGIDDAIIYIGNGFSDRCAVKYADVVFAKDELLRYCQENNITYQPFRTFEDILMKFRKMIEAGGIRKRHQAELRRREAYLAE